MGITEAARRIGVHPNTLRSWVDRELVPVSLTPTGYRRFSEAQVDEIMTRMRQRTLPGMEPERAPKLAA